MQVKRITSIIFIFRLLLFIFSLSGAVVIAAADRRQTDAAATAPATVLSRSLFLDAAAAGDSRVVVGERGHILVARKGGPWLLAAVPTAATLTAVYFHDENLGWAAGHDAVILKTTDGGRHWRRVYSDPDRDAPVLDLWFADSSYGIAIGAYGLYLITTDGGETWTNDELHIIRRKVPDETKSTPAGPAVTGAPDQYDLHLNNMAVSETGKLYIAAESGRLYRSDDLGRTWQELPSPYHGSLFGVMAVGRKSLLVFGLRGHLFRSDDEGDSWQEIATGTGETLTGAIRLQDGSIVITGMGGVVLSSTDQGRTFTLTELRYKHGYAAVLEAGPDRLILAGDHGLETWGTNDVGLAHD